MSCKTATRLSLFAAAIGAGFFLSGRPAEAVTFSTIAVPAITVTDSGYDGTPGSMASSTINVPAASVPGTITDVNVTIAIDHPYVGDLTIKLVSPSGTNVTLLNRPGLITHDDGSQAGGFSANLSSLFPITYDDQASDDAEKMGLGLLDGQVIGDPGNSSPSAYDPDADDVFSEGLGDQLATYIGENGGGVWTLYIGDSATDEIGSLDHWSLDIQTTASTAAVPEGNTALLAGVALAGIVVVMVSRKRVLPAPIENRKSQIENDPNP